MRFLVGKPLRRCTRPRIVIWTLIFPEETGDLLLKDIKSDPPSRFISVMSSWLRRSQRYTHLLFGVRQLLGRQARDGRLHRDHSLYGGFLLRKVRLRVAQMYLSRRSKIKLAAVLFIFVGAVLAAQLLLDRQTLSLPSGTGKNSLSGLPFQACIRRRQRCAPQHPNCAALPATWRPAVVISPPATLSWLTKYSDPSAPSRHPCGSPLHHCHGEEGSLKTTDNVHDA